MNMPYQGQAYMPSIAPQQQPPFQQGYMPQQTPPPNFTPQQSGQLQQPMLAKPMQELKFYKSGIFGFSSAAGKFQRDSKKMQSQGWRVAEMAFLGTNFFWQRIIAVVYER